MKNKVLKITFCSIMAAMAIALNSVASLQITPSIKITFYALPLMVTSILYGFKIGFLTGLVAGVILQLISPYGVTITAPVWALAPILWGTVPGLIFKPFNKINKYLAYVLAVFFASIASNLSNTLAMYCDCLFIADAYYTAASILLDWPGRILTMFVTMIPYIIITFIVCDRLKNIFLFDKNVEDDNIEDEEEI